MAAELHRPGRPAAVFDIDRAFADETNPADDIRSRVSSGTLDAATFLTIPAAQFITLDQIDQLARALPGLARGFRT